MAKEKEPKVELEREYIVPLRKEFKKVPEFRRAKRALKALKQFIARHMRVEDRDLRRKMGAAGRWQVEHGKNSVERRKAKLKEVFDQATASSSFPLF